MEHSNVKSDYAGYTTDAVNQIYMDVCVELGAFFKNGGMKGSPEHVEISERVSEIGTLACENRGGF